MAIVSKNIAARNDCFSSFKTPNNRFITLKYLLNFKSLSILRALKILKSTSNIIGSNPDNTANKSIIAGQVDAYFNLVKSLFFLIFSSTQTQILKMYSIRKTTVENLSKIKNSNHFFKNKEKELSLEIEKYLKEKTALI